MPSTPSSLSSCLALLVSLLATGPLRAVPGPEEVQDQAVPDWPQPHLGTIDAVRTEANERNAVLAVFVIQENEEANDRFRDEVYHDPDLAKKCRELVVLLVNDGTHALRKVKERVDGKVREREICSKYGTPSCDDHRRYFDRVFQDYSDGETIRTPQLLLVLPGGKIQERLVDEHDIPKILQRIDAAQKLAGPSISAAALAEAKREASTARAAQSQARWTRAWKAWSRTFELAPRGDLSTEAKEGIENAVGGMRDELAAARTLLEAGKVTAGYARLLDLRERYRGGPLEKEALQAVRDAEKNKEWSDEIKAYQREMAAEELWKKVMAAVKEGKTRTAERFASRLLKKYGDTRAGRKAREEFPHLAGDGDGA